MQTQDMINEVHEHKMRYADLGPLSHGETALASPYKAQAGALRSDDPTARADALTDLASQVRLGADALIVLGRATGPVNSEDVTTEFIEALEVSLTAIREARGLVAEQSCDQGAAVSRLAAEAQALFAGFGLRGDEFDGGPTWEMFEEAYRSDTPEVRSAAVRGIAAFKEHTNTTINFLIRRLRDEPDSEVRQTVIDTVDALSERWAATAAMVGEGAKYEIEESMQALLMSEVHDLADEAARRFDSEAA